MTGNSLRSIHVVPAITEEASGPSYSVVRLCESLIAEGGHVSLAALDWAPMPSVPAYLRRFPVGRGPRKLGRSPAMRRWLTNEAASGDVDVIHNHGMWQMNAVYPGWASRSGKTRLVVSPRGSFSEWAMTNGSRFKRLFWPLVQRPALKHAACFHATAESEYLEIRRLGFRQPVAIIPNGVDVPNLIPNKPAQCRTLLFLGRIHPKKGVDILLRSWGAVMRKFPDWRLEIVGTDSGFHNEGGHYLTQMSELVSALHLERVRFVGPLYGQDKLDAYRGAELFVLPTHSENFGMTVAEALAAGTPTIVTRGAPWGGLEQHRAGWWIDIGPDALIACFEDALSRSPQELDTMGAHGREWMIQEYSWQRIGRIVNQTYHWLARGSEAPTAWIKFD